MKNVSSVLITAAVTFFASLVLGQLIAPKAMGREDVEKMIRDDRDKPAIQAELKHLNDGLTRIEDKLDKLIMKSSR